MLEDKEVQNRRAKKSSTYSKFWGNLPRRNQTSGSAAIGVGIGSLLLCGLYNCPTYTLPGIILVILGIAKFHEPEITLFTHQSIRP